MGVARNDVFEKVRYKFKAWVELCQPPNLDILVISI